MNELLVKNQLILLVRIMIFILTHSYACQSSQPPFLSLCLSSYHFPYCHSIILSSVYVLLEYNLLFSSYNINYQMNLHNK